ncbi:MAG: hypothetical protein K0Q81_816 [Paenibacillus sp.]|nr:hypothetical protein [Paenibacillus sp.]
MRRERGADTDKLKQDTRDKSRIPVIGFAGFSGSGKTTLAVEVIRSLELEGKRVAVVKHDGHGHYKEAEGTDSAAYRAAGASTVAVVSPDSLVIYEKKAEPTLEDVLQKLYHNENSFDLIVVEGFKASPIPKIAVVREVKHLSILDHVGTELLAIAASKDLYTDSANVPMFDLDDPSQIVRFIIQYMEERSG